MCVPEDPIDVAGDIGDNFVRPEDMPAHLRPKKPKKKLNEFAEPLKLIGKMERCIQEVKIRIRKSGKTFKDQSIKSAAIAICRSKLKQ
jgi:transcription initiation factor TFIIIB Brf1 subunit/transcription initiation factor TFIIB